jgi:tetratricopeptide (TPR) repeat protein
VFDLSLEGTSWVLTMGSLALEARGMDAGSLLGRPDAASATISLLITVPAVVLAIVYLRYGFGFFSRNFERQSDLHALALTGSPDPIVRSLEKITGFSPTVRLMPNWHHFGVQERIDFLRECGRDPGLVAGHHRKVRWMMGGYLLFLAAVGVFLVGWKTQHWGKTWTLGMLQRVAEQRLQSQPDNPSLWLALGSIALEQKAFPTAERALHQALRLSPDHPEALNNLAWLYATADGAFRKPREALELARKAAALRPASPHILDTLAEALFINGQTAEALETGIKALGLATPPLDHYRSQVKRFEGALPRRP